ncbi:MAG TPA: tetratricopeptide repeat protein [bacterium]
MLRLAAGPALIALLVLAAFLPVLGNGFVSYDDEAGIVRHPIVSRGLSPHAVAWAARATEQGNWMPLTRLSHLADVSLFGMHPGAHHGVSLLIHVATAILLWAFLRRATGAPGASLAVALLFALHPLRVESVAWASERKDVLAGLCWMLTLLAWTGYLRRPSGARYLAVVAAHALGLMSKASVVTLPVVLFLLDFWPFGRLRPRVPTPGARPLSSAGAIWGTARPCVLEKAPLLAMSAAAAIVTYVAQRMGGAVDVEGIATPAIRAASAVSAVWGYLERLLWPGDLSVLTMHVAGHRPLAGAIWRGAVFAAATAGAAMAWRRWPYLTVGWLWYPVALLPMSGLIQVGVQGMADRYTYLPLIGPALALVWSLRPAAARRPAAAIAAAAAVSLLLAAATWRQCLYWRDSVALFGRAVALSPGNLLARANLGHALTAAGRLAEADDQYRAVLETFPGYPRLRYLLAENALRLGDPRTALGWLDEEARLRPEDPAALGAIADLLVEQGREDEAAAILRELVSRFPGSAPGWSNLGALLGRAGRLEEAAAAFTEAARLDPGLAEAREGLREVQRLRAGPAGDAGSFLTSPGKQAQSPPSRGRATKQTR